MAKNCNILLIRHAEKPASGTDLSIAGQERAQAYIIYLQNYQLNGATFKADYIFCAADSSDSHRPKLTIKPFADAIGLPIDDKHKDKDYQKVVDDLQDSKYDGKNVVICWHHEEALALAAGLGASSSTLPATSKWPTTWPGDVFGWLLQICLDGSGKIDTANTICVNEQLMYDDYGQEPPNGN